MKQVRSERTGWRDQNLSERHRRYGWNCPAIDLDFLLLEYDKGKASAIVEYKNEKAQPQYKTHPTYQALIDLGNRAGIPVFAVRYATDFSWWKVVPLNSTAQKWIPAPTMMNELQWVNLLYKIRGYELPADFLTDAEVAL